MLVRTKKAEASAVFRLVLLLTLGSIGARGALAQSSVSSDPASHPAGPGQSGPSDAGEVARRVHRTGDYPDRLPLPESELADTAGAQDRAQNSQPRRRARRNGSALPSAALAYGVLAVVLIALVMLVGYIIVTVVRRRASADSSTNEASARRRPRKKNAQDDDDEEGPSVQIIEDDPEVLAAQGRFADAVAALLYRSLLAIGFDPEGKGRSRTAREILAGVPFDSPQRHPLAQVVAIQEGVAFGGEDADQATFETVRTHYAQIHEAGAAP